MGIENQPGRSNPARTWIFYLLILGMIVGVLVALNTSGIKTRVTQKIKSQSGFGDYAFQGDMYIKYLLSDVHPSSSKSYAKKAIEFYSEDIPSPAAYRRIGVAKQELLYESGLRELFEIGSAKATKDLSGCEKNAYVAEASMWMDIYGSSPISKAEASRYLSRIDKLDLGPLKTLATAQVYRKSGDTDKANALIKNARRSARASVFGMLGLFACLALAGALGLILVIVFSTRYGDELQRAGHPKIQSSVLFISFFAYLVSYFLLSVVLQTLLLAVGVDVSDESGILAYLAIQIVAMFGAYALGRASLRTLTAYSHEDRREIGLRRLPLMEAVRWGVGGYCAALPLLALGIAISNALFAGFRTPENPIVSVASQGRAEFVITLIMAVVIAPLVEETAFRGYLYTGLRTKMGVWGAAILSGAVFSIIHPTLPGGFLPILALGMVFALLREKTGSLLPGMIAHGLNNAIMFLLVFLFS